MRRFALGPIIIAGVVLLHGGIVCAQDSLKALQEELKGGEGRAYASHRAGACEFLRSGRSRHGKSRTPRSRSTNRQAARCPNPPGHHGKRERDGDGKGKSPGARPSQPGPLGAILQLQCGMLHYAALFVAKPDQEGLQDQWVTWLKSAAQAYPPAIATFPPGTGPVSARWRRPRRTP